MTMTGKISKSLIILIALFIGNTIYAQNSTVSPYSMFGVGQLTQREHATSAGMGHASIALAPSEWINIGNPAAINNLDSTTFYFNIQLKGLRSRLSSGYEHQSQLSGNIDGITMGFRATDWWGVALGYAPYSSVGYDFEETRTMNKDGIYYRARMTGSGGLQNAFLTNAISLFKKHISLGVNVGAMWGAFNYKETAKLQEALGGENIYNLKKYTCNNLFFEYGVQFHFNIGKNNFRFGGVYNDKRKLLSSYDHIVSNDISASLFFDDDMPLRNEFHVPASYGAGFAYTRGKFLLTADYRFNEWSSIRSAKFKESASYRDNWSCGGGIEISCGEPNDPFYKRIKYRIGGYYSPNYILIHKQEINDKAVTLGMTIPMGRYSNAIVLGYEYQDRGSEMGGLVKEKVHNIRIALNIRETWFKKSKFD